MTTNQLFREVLDGRVPMPRRRTQEQFMREAAAYMGMRFEDLADVIRKLEQTLPPIPKPPAPTPPWAGNIATQKRPKGNRYR